MVTPLPMLDYLEELILIQSGENGRFTIPETEQGYQDYRLTIRKWLN